MLLNTFIKNLQNLVLSTEIKYTKQAKANETVNSLRSSDAYTEAVKEIDIFASHDTYSIEAINLAGVPGTPDQIMNMHTDKSLIPKEYRAKVLENERMIIIRDYEEENNYYRTLLGLPPTTDSKDDYFYISQEDAIKYDVPFLQYVDTPIHEMDKDDIFKLKMGGYTEKLLKANPSKKYLDFMGYDAINLLKARSALNFSILRINVDVIPEGIYDIYVKTYSECREYFMMVIYNQDLAGKYEMYDNFIALCIMVMTIQRCASQCFEMGISRDFYDWIFIQNLYNSYNVPFLESLPMEYHMLLIKNLNIMLQYKSTDKILFDLCSLLGYGRMTISKYFLVKEHLLDNNEKPIFNYRLEDERYKNCPYCGTDNSIKAKTCINTECNEDLTNVEITGKLNLVEDTTKMYEYYFQAVDIKEDNMALAILDKSNRLDYDEVIENDPYWWEDINLIEKKQGEVYSYVESKYISLNLMYKMTEMLFEITYAFRLFIDKYKDIENLTIKLPKVSDDKEFKLFDIVIFLVALTCKANGFKDYTITTPSKISHIYGFNFNEEEREAIQTIINDNMDRIDPAIIAYIYTILDPTINSTYIADIPLEDTDNDKYIWDSDEEAGKYMSGYFDENGDYVPGYSKNMQAYLEHMIPIYKSDSLRERAAKLERRDALKESISTRLHDILQLKNPSDVNTAFRLLREYNDYIVNKMFNTKDIDEYNLYKKLFKITLVSETQTEMFDYEDEYGEKHTYTSYLEYLKDNSSIMGYTVENIDKDDIGEMMDHVLTRLEDLLESINDDELSLKYTYFLNDNNIPVVQAIVTLVNFFKSYTVDLASLNIIYLFDSKFYNNVKLIGDLQSMSATIIPRDELNTLYFDDTRSVFETVNYLMDKYHIDERKRGYVNIYMGDHLFDEDTVDILSRIDFSWTVTIIDDDTGYVIGEITTRDPYDIKDRKFYSLSKLYNTEILVKDETYEISYAYNMRDTLTLRGEMENLELSYLKQDIQVQFPSDGVRVYNLVDSKLSQLYNKIDAELYFVLSDTDRHSFHSRIDYGEGLFNKDTIKLVWEN